MSESKEDKGIAEKVAGGAGAAGYGVAKSIKNKRKLEEENHRLREELAKK